MKARVEDGFFKVANALGDALASHQLTSREFRVLLAIMRGSYGWRRAEVAVDSVSLSAYTGLDDSSVRKALRSLLEAQILKRDGKQIRINSTISDWAKRRTGPGDPTVISRDKTSRKRHGSRDKTSRVCGTKRPANAGQNVPQCTPDQPDEKGIVGGSKYMKDMKDIEPPPAAACISPHAEKANTEGHGGGGFAWLEDDQRERALAKATEILMAITPGGMSVSVRSQFVAFVSIPRPATLRKGIAGHGWARLLLKALQLGVDSVREEMRHEGHRIRNGALTAIAAANRELVAIIAEYEEES